MKLSQPLSLLVRQLRHSSHLPPSCLSARFFPSYPPPGAIQKRRYDFNPTCSSNVRGLIPAALHVRYNSASAAAISTPALPASRPAQEDKSHPSEQSSSSTSRVANLRALPPSSTPSSSSSAATTTSGTSGSSTSSSTTTTTTTTRSSSASFPLVDRPSYQITFTCKPCLHRSTHTMTKQGYHHGTVLITCPSCKNRHVISDHLKIFADLSFTVEDLMRDKGELVKRGSISQNGDIEFWEDEKGEKGMDAEEQTRI